MHRPGPRLRALLLNLTVAACSLAPGRQAVMQCPQYRTRIQINSNGLRGPERGYGKPAGLRRVLLLGDSLVEGYTVTEPRLVCDLVARHTMRTACCAS